MLLGALAAGAGCLLLGLALGRGLGVSGWAIAAFVWTIAVIALVTLIPAQDHPGIVPAEGRLVGCSTDIGGPAPDGFWIFSGGQRLLNTAIFVPSGMLLVVAAARWRSVWLTVPAGLVALAAYSSVIEYAQLEVARIDRACDLTDVIDNVSGAALGVVLGIVVALLLRPWRSKRR